MSIYILSISPLQNVINRNKSSGYSSITIRVTVISLFYQENIPQLFSHSSILLITAILPDRSSHCLYTPEVTAG